MDKYHPPQPERFQKYYETKDKTGFMIDGCDYVFKFDKYGGWLDEFQNYYNADGQPDNEPEYSDEDDYGQWSDNDEEQEDQFQKLYGPSANFEEIQEDHHQSKQVLEKIAKNLAILAKHDSNSKVRINFQILDRKKPLQEKKQKKEEQRQQQQQESLPSTEEIISRYRKKGIRVVTCFYDDEEIGKDSGWFVVQNVKQAQKLINYEAEKITGFDLTFDAETLQQLLADPLDTDQQDYREIQKKYVEIEQGQRVYTLLFDGHGIDCKKEELKQWFKTNNFKLKIVKIKKGLNKKIPIIKLLKADAEKLQGMTFNEKKITLQLQKAKEEVQEEKGKQQTGQVSKQ